jgi:predicted O-methyltransferase YrrM
MFTDFTEYPIGLSAACILGFLGWIRSGALAQWTSRNIGLRVSLMALLVGSVSSIMTTTGFVRPQAAVRNFYGILRVRDTTDANGPLRQLTHGRTKHGFQYLSGPQHFWPTSYYGPTSGVGLVLTAMREPNRRVAVIGLGTGTIAAWGRAGDTFRFYEINPEVESIARSWFTFLKDSKARTEVVLGDARVQLERELASGTPQSFDVIAGDAFSSDAIPMHLLTAEAVKIYAAHLKPGGVLLFHISSRTLQLEPVVRALAEQLKWKAVLFQNAQDLKTGEDSARWIAVTANSAFLEQEALKKAAWGWTISAPQPILWTDDFASLLHVLKR